MMKLAEKAKRKVLDLYRLGRLFLSERRVFGVVLGVIRAKITYLEASALLDLHDVVKMVEQEKRPGVLIEAGVALGGSSLVIAASKSDERPLYLYDAFETIPAPSEFDGADAHKRYEVIASGKATGIKGGNYYGYQDRLFHQVNERFVDFNLPPQKYNVRLIKGLYEDSLWVREPVAMAHLDCDWYDSVMVCLQRIVPQLISGGILVVDDYEAWSGCRRAVDSYFAGREHEFDFVMKSRLHIVRR
jgi:asparagine synthase (glutamine-hydrolysing)